LIRKRELEGPLKVLPSVTGLAVTTAYTVRGSRGSDKKVLVLQDNKRKQKKITRETCLLLRKLPTEDNIEYNQRDCSQ